MNILHSNNEKTIAYHNHFVAKREAPCLIFHHGLMSSMNGDKALFVESYCKKKDIILLDTIIMGMEHPLENLLTKLSAAGLKDCYL